MSYLLPLSSCSTPGWNDPPAVLDPTKTFTSPSTGALANRHRRPVHPSIQVLFLVSSNLGQELLIQKYNFFLIAPGSIILPLQLFHSSNCFLVLAASFVQNFCLESL